jgi:CO dehydrogenase/acetyl-CoA synthase beta subunit
MEKLEQILQKKNKKQKELFTKAIELGNKAQAIYEEKEELLNKELEKTSIQFKERDTEYQDFLTKPSGENEISQDIITLYEKF